MKFLAGFLALFLLGAPLWADSLVHNGKTYSDVYVREGNSSYYIQHPSTGEITAVPKSEVGDVAISSDAGLRESLLRRWKSAKAEKPMPALTSVPKVSNPSPRPAGPPPVVPAEPTPARARNGQDGVSIKLENVPMRTALKATLRQKNLDYKVHDNYIYVSTPQRLRQEPLERVQPRLFALNYASDTLPKIVVRNPGGAGYPQMYGGGMSGGGMGGGGMIGGGMRGGGMMGGGMGMRGGMMGGYGGGQHFSNISDLFSTIDDRLVGETPAVIGIGGLSAGPSRPPR